MRILITGAAGNVASMTLPALEERYDLRLTDRCYPMRRTRAPFHLADVTDRATSFTVCQPTGTAGLI